MQDESKYYELSYLLKAQLSQEEANGQEQELRDLIGREAGVIESWDGPKHRSLAYPISGEREAYLGALRFNLAIVRVATLQEKLKENKNILRFMLLEWQKPPLRKAPKPQHLVEKEERIPTDEKALDEKLEEIFAKNI